MRGDPSVVAIVVETNGSPVFNTPSALATGGPKRAVGLGIGLFLEKQIAEMPGGTLEVSSSPAGASFSLRVPIPEDVETPETDSIERRAGCVAESFRYPGG